MGSIINTTYRIASHCVAVVYTEDTPYPGAARLKSPQKHTLLRLSAFSLSHRIYRLERLLSISQTEPCETYIVWQRHVRRPIRTPQTVDHVAVTAPPYTGAGSYHPSPSDADLCAAASSGCASAKTGGQDCEGSADCQRPHD